MPTVYIRKDNYDAIVAMKQDPTAFVNHLIDATFTKRVDVVYEPKSINDSSVSTDEHQKVTTKKQTKR